jgi:DNA polymerase elongation subunit (family B)
VVRNILLGDYESLYPNAIIAANLGIDSILDQDTGNSTNMDSYGLKARPIRESYRVNVNFIDKYVIKKIE